MSVEIKKSQEVQQVDANTNSKPKEFSFFAELKSLIKRAIIPEKDNIETANPQQEAIKVKSQNNNPTAPSVEKKANTLEGFIQSTDDATYNKVIDTGKALLYAIKGAPLKKEAPKKSSQQQQM